MNLILKAAQFAILFCLLPLLFAGCSLPQVKAEDRIFLPLTTDYLGQYQLPKQVFQDTPVGGLSGLTYDRQHDRFYAISDDRSEHAPARFYTLKLTVDRAQVEHPPEHPDDRRAIQAVEVEAVTTLKIDADAPFARGSVDPEGIALSPRQTVFISSEGVPDNQAEPFINEFALQTGQQRGKLPIPAQFLPRSAEGTGIRSNLGFEALTLNPGSYQVGQLEPFRLFTATESALQQDLPPAATSDAPSASPNASPNISLDLNRTPIRFLHYLIGDPKPTLLAEHLYLLDPAPPGATDNGLVELTAIDPGGHFLSLERSFGFSVGASARIFQLATGGATDISGISRFNGDWTGITPILKQPLLDLHSLGIALDNLEGMALGPRLPDGTQSLLLVSDDNFSDLQVTQFLLFRLRGVNPASL